jgi:phage terminase small subunit
MTESDFNLTEKQRIFCHEYVLDWNATRSAKVAGYSEKTAQEIGSENLSKPIIKQYIEFIQEDLAKLAGISKLKIVNELQKIALSSIAHLHNTWIELKEFEALTDEQKDAIESIDTKTERKVSMTGEKIEVQYIKIKLYSKLAAIDSLNKMMGWNATIKTEVKGNFQITERKRIKFVKKSD